MKKLLTLLVLAVFVFSIVPTYAQDNTGSEREQVTANIRERVQTTIEESETLKGLKEESLVKIRELQSEAVNKIKTLTKEKAERVAELTDEELEKLGKLSREKIKEISSKTQDEIKQDLDKIRFATVTKAEALKARVVSSEQNLRQEVGEKKTEFENTKLRYQNLLVLIFLL